MSTTDHSSWNDPSTTSDLLDQAQTHAKNYLKSLEDRRVFPSQDDLARLETFDEPLPEDPSIPVDVIDMLADAGAANAVAQTGGRYFGFVTGGVLPVTLAARWLADTWDQNSALQVMSPISSKLEEICEKWLSDLLMLPAGTAAGFVSGTTMANFCGLLAARNELLRRQGWDSNVNGLYGAPPIRVIVGEEAHAAVSKALGMLGMGSENVEIVPADDQGRMIAEQIPHLDRPALIVAQAGNVNSGAFDPVGEICDRVRDSGSWVHVDGAFGLWAAASNTFRPLFDGTQLADSWSTDAHKTLNVPYDCGIVFCRDREALASAFRSSGSYFIYGDHRDGMNYTPSMSRRARGIELWAALKTLGRSGVGALVDQLCDRAGLFAEKLAAEGFTIRNEVVFNQILVSCQSDDLTVATQKHVELDGTCWCGGSTWKGDAVIRISVCDWSTSINDVDRSVAAFVKAREQARRVGP